MRKKRLRIMIMVLSLTPMLTGCWGYKEFEHQFYPHAIAIDKQNGKYIMYIQVLDMSQLGKTEGGKKSEGVGSWVGIGSGETLDEAAHDFYQIAPRSVNWGHVNALVLSKNVLKDQHWTNAFGLFTRFNQFRYTTWVFCTKESLRDVLTTAPVLENTPLYSALGDPIELYNGSSFIRPMRLNELIANLSEPAEPHLIPEISVVPNRWLESKQDYPTLVLSGYAMFNDQGQLTGWVSRKECLGFRWIDSKLKRTTLNIKQNGKLIGSVVLNKPQLQIHYEKGKQGIQYALMVSIKGITTEKFGSDSLQVLDKIAAQEIQKEIYETYLTGLSSKVDLLGLQDSLYRTTPSLYHEMKKSDKFLLTPESLASIQVRVNVLNSGRTLEGVRRFTEDE